MQTQLHHNIFAGSSGSVAVNLHEDNGNLFESCNCYWDNPDGDTSGFTMDDTSFVSDPLFCDPEANDFTLRSSSPCAPPGITGCGLVGALPVECGPISLQSETWAAIKGMYR